MKLLFYIILVLSSVQNALCFAKWNCLVCGTSGNKQCEDEYDQGHEGGCQSSETNVGCLSVTQSTSEGFKFYKGCGFEFKEMENAWFCRCDGDNCNDSACPAMTTSAQITTTSSTTTATTTPNYNQSKCQVCGQDGEIGKCNTAQDNGHVEFCDEEYVCYFVYEKLHGLNSEPEYFRYCGVDLDLETDKCYSQNTDEKHIFVCTCKDSEKPCNKDADCLFTCN